MVSGACVVIVGSLQLPEDSVLAVRQIGFVSASMGVLILVLQPQLTLAWYVEMLQDKNISAHVLPTYLDTANGVNQNKVYFYLPYILHHHHIFFKDTCVIIIITVLKNMVVT